MNRKYDKTMSERNSNLHFNNDIGMYYCGKRTNTKNHVYGPETRNHYLFVLADSGTAILDNGIRFSEKDLLVMCPGKEISYKALTDWSISWIGLYGDMVDYFINILGITDKDPVTHLSLYPEIKEILEKIFALSENRSFENNLRIASLIYSFFNLLLINKSTLSKRSTVENAVKIIDFNYGTDINITELSSRIGFDPAYFSRIFKEKIGISPKKYLLKKRMEHAKFLLKNSDLSVKEIAEAVGYSDALYFSRIFKKYCGISPANYFFEDTDT